jgi:multidrug efflux pump subunit AcrA (membrane-fusion protein)
MENLMRTFINKIKDYHLLVLLLLLVVAAILLVSSKSKTELIKPVRKEIIDAVFAHGYTINSDEYLVATKTEGFILKSYIKEGDYIEVGDPLFQLSSEVQSEQFENALAQYNDALYKASPNSPEIVSLQTQIQQAASQVAFDKINYDRQSALMESDLVSQFDYDKSKLQYETSLSNLQVLEKSLEDLKSTLQLNLENAESQLEIQKDYLGDYFIRSTKKGQVLNIFKEQGELAKRGESLAKIGSGSTIAKLFIAEEDITHVKVGQNTRIALNTDKENPLDAVISKIYPAFDFAEQSFILEAEFLQQYSTILANTQLQANIYIAHKENALVIPAEFLRANNKVTLADDSEVTVAIGIESGKWVEIISGINEEHAIKKAD